MLSSVPIASGCWLQVPFSVICIYGPPPNGLPLSCAALLDREGSRADSSFQNRPDLGAAQRRRLHALVGSQSFAMAKSGMNQSSLNQQSQADLSVDARRNMLAVRLRALGDDHPTRAEFRIDEANAMAPARFDHDDAVRSKRHRLPLYLKLGAPFQHHVVFVIVVVVQHIAVGHLPKTRR
jgi:hypothetical protein